jgi:hypothetical protein
VFFFLHAIYSLLRPHFNPYSNNCAIRIRRKSFICTALLHTPFVD